MKWRDTETSAFRVLSVQGQLPMSSICLHGNGFISLGFLPRAWASRDGLVGRWKDYMRTKEEDLTRGFCSNCQPEAGDGG